MRVGCLVSIGLLSALSCWGSLWHSVSRAEGFRDSLQVLQSAKVGSTGQSELQQAWDVVAKVEVDSLPAVLHGMKDVGPLAENWLRAAVDAIAERELRKTNRLPAAALEQFVRTTNESPRARRTAFEWLVQVDESAYERLMTEMLDDPSLELRHDAVEKLITEAAAESDEATKRKMYRRAFKSAREMGQVLKSADALKELGESPELIAHFGYVTDWMVIGPFDNTGGEGFDKAYPPETEVDFSKRYPGKNGEIGWNAHQSEGVEPEDLGLIDLNKALTEEKGVVAYAAIKFNSPSEQQLQCRYETVNASKIWVNGEPLASHPAYHSGDAFDQHIVPANIRAGENTILLKICQNEQTEVWARPWVFQLRIADHLGGGSLQGLQLQ